MFIKCSKEAFEACPDHEICKSFEYADFEEGSYCDRFNQKIAKRMRMLDDSDKDRQIATLKRQLDNYQTAEKEGRLIFLPVKRGDTVYFAAWFGTESHIVTGVSPICIHTVDARDNRSTADFYLDNFGRGVFLTQAEAEAVMKRWEDNVDD